MRRLLCCMLRDGGGCSYANACVIHEHTAWFSVRHRGCVFAGVFVMPVLMGADAARSEAEEPMCVLIAGWKTQQFMAALLRELDRGQSQLPLGSHITFFNEHPTGYGSD